MTRVKLPGNFVLRPRVECNECFDIYNMCYLKDSIKIYVSTMMLFKRYSRQIELLNYVEAQKTFFRPVEKLKMMEMNKWISNFMTHLRKFYINHDLAFVYNDLSKEFGVAAADIKVLNPIQAGLLRAFKSQKEGDHIVPPLYLWIR